MTELKEDLLQKVNGGAFDWDLFYKKMIDAMKNPQAVLTKEHKDLIEALKNKDYIQAASLTISLLGANDELVTKAYLECMLGS